MAIQRLVHWAKSKDPGASVRACQTILDRAYGKAAQAIEHKGTVTHDLSSLTDAELLAIIEEEDRLAAGAAPQKRTKRLH